MGDDRTFGWTIESSPALLCCCVDSSLVHWDGETHIDTQAGSFWWFTLKPESGVGTYLTANKHVFNLQRKAYSSTVIYRFCSFKGCTKTLFFIIQETTERIILNSILIYYKTARTKTSHYCWINTCEPMEVPFNIWKTWLHGFGTPCYPTLTAW